MVNADDFGFTPDVNDGIVDAHRRGILTATTLMANGEAFDDAVAPRAGDAALDIGCHLVLVGGRSLLTRRPLPRSVPQLLAALARREIRPYEELRGTGAADSGRPACARRTSIPTSTRTWRRRCWTRWRGWARSSTSAGCAARSTFR